MNTLSPGTRVLVRWAGLLHTSPCGVHLQKDLPLFQNVGIVDRIDDRRGDHCVVVVFPTIHIPPLGSCWVDVFIPDELVPFE